MASARAAELIRYVGANVRRMRLRRGLTQERLAEDAGLELRFVQRVERAETNLSVAALVGLADALGVPPGQLFKKAELPPAQRGRPKKRLPPRPG
jgi:transcriptional regulator with XRE-family HTH domain